VPSPQHAAATDAERCERDNIVLVGMPGVGKSSVGVVLAKAVGCHFLDTDLVIQMQEGLSLQQLIDRRGLAAFRALEEQCVLRLDCDRHVIATGGSVVYGASAMQHLRELGRVIHLELPFDELERRLDDLSVRGVVMEPGQSLRQLYRERLPLYRARAHHSLDVRGLSPDHVIRALRPLVERPRV